MLVTEHNRIIAEISLPKEEIKSLGVEERLAVSGKLQKAKRNLGIALAGKIETPVDWISVYDDNKSEV